MHNWYKSRQHAQLIQITQQCAQLIQIKGNMNNWYKSRQHAQMIQIKTECTVIFTRTQAGHPAWVVQWHTKSWRQPARAPQTWDMPYTITTTVGIKSCREIRKFSEPTFTQSKQYNTEIKRWTAQPGVHVWDMKDDCFLWFLVPWLWFWSTIFKMAFRTWIQAA